MNLTQEQLDEIESMSGLFFSPAEIAINLNVDKEEFCELLESGTGPAHDSYFRGRIKTEIELRQSILQSALNGSSPAQQIMREYQIKSSI